MTDWRAGGPGGRERVAALLLQYARWAVRDLGISHPEDDDVAQITVDKLLAWLEQGNTPTSRGPGLVRTVAKRIWIDRQRKRKREDLEEDPAQPVQVHVPEPDQDELLHILKEARRRLSAEDDAIIERIYAGGLKNVDLAEEELARRIQAGTAKAGDPAAARSCRNWADQKVSRARARLKLVALELARERGFE